LQNLKLQTVSVKSKPEMFKYQKRYSSANDKNLQRRDCRICLSPAHQAEAADEKRVLLAYTAL